MLKNYLKIAFRNLKKYKGFAFINISGIALGITGCLLIGLFVWDEWKFDKTVPGGDNIYRLYAERFSNSGNTTAACTPPAFATFLKQHYPEVDETARILMITVDKFLMENGDKANYEEKGMFVDSTFLQVFQIPLLKGNAKDVFATANSVVLSQALAQKYFGNENPIGKNIKIDKSDYAVTGVLGNLPDHFHLNFNYLISLSAVGIPKQRMEKWTWSQFYTYVKLKPGADVNQLQDKFQAYVKKEIYPEMEKGGWKLLPVFQQLKNVHLQSADFIYDNAIRGNETYVNALTITACFVLLIACFNFINLSTARSFRRAKEIGVRKVIGAERKQLIIQFLSETCLMAFIAMIVAVAAAFLILPLLNQLTGKSITFNPFSNPVLLLLLLASGLLIGMLAGIYPALILSGFDPVRVLKSMKITGGGASWLRHSLVVVQFSLSALLIVVAIIVYKQTQYLNDKDLGFNKEQVIYFQTRGEIDKNLEVFKTGLRKLPGVVAVTSGYGLPGDQFATDEVIVPGNEENKRQSTTLFIGDHDYIKTLGLSIISGRDFSRQMSTDQNQAFIINETAVKEFGFETPEKAIGKPLHWNEWSPADTTQPVKKGKVIGVVKDFHYKNLHEKIAASVIQLYPQENFKVAAKLNTRNISGTIQAITAEWNKFSPGYPIDYKFMDETYGAMYSNEGKLASLLWIFTLTAIVVGCMGLFGLAAFHAEQRTKEIGIRKVLGASIFNIVGLLSINFIKMVLIAAVIAFPIAWWAMNKWLEDYSYRITINGWIFAVAGAAIILIALITVSSQAIKAAFSNPVKSLRTE